MEHQILSACTITFLLNRVGWMVAWVTWVRGLRGSVGAWIEWVKFLRGLHGLRGSTFHVGLDF